MPHYSIVCAEVFVACVKDRLLLPLLLLLFVQLLVRADFIHHVVDEHHFEDTYLFFRFRQDGELCMVAFIHELVYKYIIAVISGTLVPFAYCTLPHANPMACRISRETLLFSVLCDDMCDCSVQCANRTRKPETAVYL